MRATLGLLVTATLGLPSGSTAQELTVYHVALRGTLDERSVTLVAQAVAAATANGSALVLELESAGTHLRSARAVAAALDDAAVPTFVFVDSDVLDGALLILLAADSAFIAPTGRLGWHRGQRSPADPPESPNDQLQRELRHAMARRGIDPALSAPLLAGSAAVPGVVTTPDRVLVRDTAARHLGLAHLSPSVDSLLTLVGLAGADVETVDAGWLGVTVRVDNRNWRDVRIYVTQATQRVRLSTVTSMSEVSINLSDVDLALGSQMQLIAEVIGSSERLATPWMHTRPGLVIEWRLENVLSQSSYFIWVR